MKIRSFQPINTLLKGLIEQYLLIESNEYVEVQTLPNGRIDASITMEGEIEWLFQANKFKVLDPCTFYPPTQSKGLARSQRGFKCISIKFYPHVLAHEIFQNMKLLEPLSFHKLFGCPEKESDLIGNLKKVDTNKELAHLLDTYFLEKFISSKNSNWMQKVILALEDKTSSQLSIRDLATEINMSVKTLDRRFVRAIGITPVMFSKIIQLQQTVRNIRKVSSTFSHGDLVEALGNGYYDQSHFTKCCKRLTGLTPKKLFRSLPQQMTDIIIQSQKTN